MSENTTSLDEFIDRLVAEKGFGVSDSEVLDQIRSDLLEQAEERINATILEHLPTEKLEEFDALLDRGDEGEIQRYCSEVIPDLDTKIAEALVDFRNAYLGAEHKSDVS